MRGQVSDVFFDLDHTLWDFERNSALAFEVIFEKHAIDLPLGKFLEHYAPINLDYWAKYRDGHISQKKLRYGRLRDSFDALSYPVADKLIGVLSEEYIHYLPKFNHLIDNAREVLEYLQPNYRLHIITNGFNGIQGSKLRNSNIAHYFQTISDSESAGVKKPHRQIFEYALSSAGASCASSVMIGDCIDADVRGAMGCGMHAILFGGTPCGDASVRQIFHLDELKQIL